MMQELYFNKIEDILQKIKKTQSETINTIADKLSDVVINGGIVYTFGAGHSHLLCEEIAARAGGLLQVRAILEPELIDIQGNGKSTELERTSGYAKIVFDYSKVREKDALIVISNSGRNSVPVEMAIEAKKAGVLVIGLVNLDHSKKVESRSPSGKKLYEVCDFVLDNCGELGDATIKVKDKPFTLGPTSTVAGAIVLQALVIQIVEKIIEKGQEPAMLMSANVDGNDDYNQNVQKQLVEKFPDLYYLLNMQ